MQNVPSATGIAGNNMMGFWRGYAVLQECQSGSPATLNQYALSIIDGNTATMESPTVTPSTGVISPESVDHFAAAVEDGLLPQYVNAVVSAMRGQIHVSPGVVRPKMYTLQFPQGHSLSGSDVFKGFSGDTNSRDVRPIMFPAGGKLYLLWVLVDTTPGMSVSPNYENGHNHAWDAHLRMEAMQAQRVACNGKPRRHQKHTGKRPFETFQGAVAGMSGAVAGMSGALKFPKKHKSG